MRVVVDTNILVSFAIRPNLDFERMFDFLAAHGVTLVSEETIGELFVVLGRASFSPYISQQSAIEYVEWYAGISEMISVTERVAACRDPRTINSYLWRSRGEADCIVSGDNDLLDMVAFGGIPVCRVAEFLQRFVD